MARSDPRKQCVWRSQRAALTLVELLAVIAIIAVLVGMLLPAVQSAREASRRVACANSGKQTGVAIHTFLSAQGRFPRIGVEPLHGPSQDETLSRLDTNYRGWLIALLPYLEETSRFDLWQNGTSVATSLENGRILAIECPTSRSIFNDLIKEANLSPSLPVSSWGAVRGGGGGSAARFAGILESYRGKHLITPAAVRDGLSQTAMLGEMGGFQRSTNRFTNVWTESGTETRLQCFNRTPAQEAHYAVRSFSGELCAVNLTWIPKSRSCGPVGQSGGCWLARNGGLPVTSWHPDGSHLVMGDGATRFVADDVDCGGVGGDPWAVVYGAPHSASNNKGVWGAIGSRAGGETLMLD